MDKVYYASSCGSGDKSKVNDTNLQESIEFLFFLPIHISFLKELEIWNKAPSRSDVSETGGGYQPFIKRSICVLWTLPPQLTI